MPMSKYSLRSSWSWAYMNFPLDIPTCRVLIIFGPNNCVGRNEWQIKRQGWPRRGSEDQVRDARQQGQARRPRQCMRHRMEDAESKGQVAKAHVRIMCVSCYHVCMQWCMYVSCVSSSCGLVWLLCTVHICSRTPCLQTRLVKRSSRKCTGVTGAVRIQLQAGQPPASISLLVSAAGANQAPEHIPGPRTGETTSDHAFSFFWQLRASAGWRLSDGFGRSNVGMPTVCPLRLAP